MKSTACKAEPIRLNINETKFDRGKYLESTPMFLACLGESWGVQPFRPTVSIDFHWSYGGKRSEEEEEEEEILSWTILKTVTCLIGDRDNGVLFLGISIEEMSE